jgi:hypothetical protein
VPPGAPTGPAVIVYLTTGGLFSQENQVVTVAVQQQRRDTAPGILPKGF